MTHDAEDKRVWQGPFRFDEESGDIVDANDLPMGHWSWNAMDEHDLVALLNDSHTPSKTEAALVEACEIAADFSSMNDQYFLEKYKHRTDWNEGASYRFVSEILVNALALVKETQGQVPENHKDVYEKGLPKEASDAHDRNHAVDNQSAAR